MSDLTDAQLDELERLAEAAHTRGNWADEPGLAPHEQWRFVVSDLNQTVARFSPRNPSDAAYIAAADPPMVLALVREVRRLRAVNRVNAGRHVDIVRWLDEARARIAELEAARGGEKAEQATIELHEAKCEVERLRKVIADGGQVVAQMQRWLNGEIERLS